MMRVRTIAILAALAIALTLPAAEAQAPSPTQKMFQYVNDYRRANGVRALKAASSLSQSSQRYAQKMMREGYFGHQSRVQASGSYRRLGEVIYLRYGTKIATSSAFRAWKRSSGHRRVMLDGRFRHMGAGYTRGRFRGRKAVIWVMQFGTP